MGKDWDYHHAKLLSVQECWRSHEQDRRQSGLGQRELCHCLYLATVKNSIGIPEDCKRLVREILQLVTTSKVVLAQPGLSIAAAISWQTLRTCTLDAP